MQINIVVAYFDEKNTSFTAFFRLEIPAEEVL